MPERQKDDGLDGEELEYWIKGLEHFPGGAEEEEETVEGETDGEVVHDGDVQIAAVGTPVAIMVMSCGLEKTQIKTLLKNTYGSFFIKRWHYFQFNNNMCVVKVKINHNKLCLD